jgi:hypothetical protein
MLDVPIFRLLGSSDQGTGRKPDGPLPYIPWMGETLRRRDRLKFWLHTAFGKWATPSTVSLADLDLRRGSLITTDDPNSNEAVRNQFSTMPLR